MAVRKLLAAVVPVAFAAILSTPAQASDLVERILLQAKQHETGRRAEQITLHAGRPAFQMRPTNGYPGTQVSLSIASHYEIFEKGIRRQKLIRRAVIDWGDGTSPTATPGGLVARHTYGTRHANGAISPTKGRDYIGRVTLHLEDGDTVTEQFRYVLWTDKATLRKGGRLLPHEEQERVWCSGGSREGPYCVETFDIQQIVFSFDGCFDHNYVEFPVANAPAAVFDVRSTAVISGGVYNQGWRADQSVNQIASLYPGHFRVYSNRGKGAQDNMSGIHYRFNPIALNTLSPELGQNRSHIVYDSVSVRLSRASRSYTSASFNSGFAQQPSESNSWITRLSLNDQGSGGGTPPCPQGARDNAMGWLSMDVEARISGRLFSLPADGQDKLPSGYYDHGGYKVE